MVIIIYCNANTNAIASDGKSVLHFASREGYLNIVECLIQHGNIINVNVQDYMGWNALHFATRYGHVDIVQFLVNNGNVCLDKVTTDNMTALQLACIHGHYDIVTCILPLLPNRTKTITPTVKSIRINCAGNTYIDVYGNVWEADNANHYYLGGEEVDTYCKYSTKNLEDAMLYKSERWGEQFTYTFPRLPNGIYYVKLHFAYVDPNRGSPKSFNISINGKIYAIHIDNWNYSSKNIIGMDKKFETEVKNECLFIVFGTEREDDKNTDKNNRAKIAGIEVKPITLDPKGSTTREQIQAYRYACRYGQIDIMKYFVRNGIIQMEKRDRYSTTGAHVAIQYDQIEIVQYVLKHYPQEHYGMTYLQYASMHGRVKTIQYMVTMENVNVDQPKRIGLLCI
jgi:ankyrin repeat protein